MIKITHPTLGWAIEYEQGSRLADLFDPNRSCVDCVQVRPWDFAVSPYEQQSYTVTDDALRAALQEYLTETGIISLA